MILENGLHFIHAQYLITYIETNLGNLALSTPPSRIQLNQQHYLLPKNLAAVLIDWSAIPSVATRYSTYPMFTVEVCLPGNVDQLRTYSGPLPS